MLFIGLRKKFIAVFCFSTAALTGFAAVSKPIPLWPGRAPGDTAELPPETDTTKPEDRAVAGKPVIRTGNVSTPTITVYSPSKGKANGAAVMVCPGGGYSILALDLEGTEICEWFNSIGVTAVLLKYRVPKRPGLEKHAAPLQDAQRAMGMVRQRAGALGIDPQRIGVLGFSAGGHLAAVLSNQHGARTYPVIDDADKMSCRPDFAVLIYPAYLTVKEKNDAVAPELPVSETNTPPTFIAMTEDDSVRVETGLFYYLALKNAKVPAEMHVYPRGGHGYGLRRTENDVTSWPDRVSDWLKTSGWLQAKR
jgi:acetyl esterase/lipase